MANDLLKNQELGCTIPFFKDHNRPCSTKKKKQEIPPKPPIVVDNYKNELKKYKLQNNKKMKQQLTTILEDVKEYKVKNQRQNQELVNELNALKKKFNKYKVKKKREIRTINNKLHFTKKELSKNKKKLIKVQKKKQKTVKRVLFVKKSKIEPFIAPVVTPEPIQVVYKEPKPVTLPNNTQWVEIVVQDDIDIYQLALLYYGDREKYREIYSANRHTIGKELKINNGMSLKIPMTDLFEEQPMMLNSY